MLLLPESLELSKVCSIISEDFTLKVEDLLALKEIQKFVTTKEALLEILREFEFEGLVKISGESDLTIVLKDEDTVYNLANLPNKMNKNEITSLLNLKEDEVKRIYKQSLFWVLVVEDATANENLQNLLNSKSLKVNDAEVRFDFTQGKALRKTILKKMQHFNYIKETDDLKASPTGKRKESYSKVGYNSNASNTSEHFSWRKKSDVSTNSKDE